MELDRLYARRRITWKITDVRCHILKLSPPIESPEFEISLGNNRTTWTLVAKKVLIGQDAYFMCVPELKSAQRLDFTTFQEVSLAKPPIDSARHQVSAKNFVGFKQTLFKVDWLLDEEMEILEDGAITVEAEVELIEDSKYREPEATQAIENYESLINDREWADYCLSCSDDKKIYVQKSIIASHCPELAELIRGRPMISEFRDIDSETMLELVRFIYCRKVNNIGTIAAKLLVVAHKYNVDNLKEICVSSLMESISVGNVFGILDIADRLKEGRLMENCIDFIKCKYTRFNTDWMLKYGILQDIWKSTIEKPTRLIFKDDRREM